MEQATRRSNRLQSRRDNARPPKRKPPPPSRRTKRTIKPSTKRKTPVYTSSSSDDGQSKPKKRPRRRTLPAPAAPTLDPKKDPTPDETNPTAITQPISTLVHEALKNSWAINTTVNMCFIFDAVSPARQFKRGEPFDESGTFPDYDDGSPGDVTETDMAAAPGLMPYMPRDNTYVSHTLTDTFATK